MLQLTEMQLLKETLESQGPGPGQVPCIFLLCICYASLSSISCWSLPIVLEPRKSNHQCQIPKTWKVRYWDSRGILRWTAFGIWDSLRDALMPQTDRQKAAQRGSEERSLYISGKGGGSIPHNWWTVHDLCLQPGYLWYRTGVCMLRSGLLVSTCI